MEDGNINEYSGDTNQYQTVSLPTFSGSNSLEADPIGPSRKHLNSTSGLADYPAEGDTIRYAVRPEGFGTEQFEAGLVFGRASDGADYSVAVVETGAKTNTFELVVTNGDTTARSATFTLSTGTWYETEVVWGTSQIDVTLTNTNTNTAVASTTVASQGTDGSNFVGWYNTAGRTLLDYLRVTP